MTQDKIIKRIARALSTGDTAESLINDLSATDLQSLMLYVYRHRSASRSPAELLRQYERTSMLQPSSADARRLIELEQAALDCATEFEAIDLAPVAPLGINTVMGQIDQNNCLATVRGAEVIADPTTVAALECARRRRMGENRTIKLARAAMSLHCAARRKAR